MSRCGLKARMDRSDEWIVRRACSRERHRAAKWEKGSAPLARVRRGAHLGRHMPSLVTAFDCGVEERS
ncbi:MAG: hypothetical protein HZB55_16270 [Deltaproteobacteria bacterium]|nr:hypothetical protein [Deltaproteobacteria bacterium]